MLSAPPYWKDGQPPEDVNTAEEESAQFSCEVEGVPTPDIKWLVNGVPIEGTFVSVHLFVPYPRLKTVHFRALVTMDHK